MTDERAEDRTRVEEAVAEAVARFTSNLSVSVKEEQ